jgi:hypothetical protein
MSVNQSTLLNAVTGNKTSTVFDLSGYNKVSVQATSAAGSVCSVAIQIRNTPTDSWATVATISNPDVNTPGYFGPGLGQIQVVLSGYASGTVTCTLLRMP